MFDAINLTTITNAELRDLFLMHGIIISHSTSRRKLAEHYSRLVHDFDDYQALAKLFDTGKGRRERLASFKIKSTATVSDFEAAAHEVIEELKINSDAANIFTMSDGSLKMNVRYKSFNFNKSEFKQLETRDAVITLEEENGMIVIRGPQNEKVDFICRELISKIEKSHGDVQIDEISLELFKNPEARTKFFVSLIDKLHGYIKHDVTDVYVYKPRINSEDTQEIENTESDSQDSELGVHITRASLKGEGVLESPEMQGLIQRGFYISKIVWQAKQSGFDSDIYEFEAQFSEPETCTRFSYLPRGHYKYLIDQQHSKSRTQLSSEEDRELSKLIETAARLSLKALNEN